MNSSRFYHIFQTTPISEIIFWKVSLNQLKDFFNSYPFQWISDFEKIPTGPNKSVYIYVAFVCPQL